MSDPLKARVEIEIEDSTATAKIFLGEDEKPASVCQAASIGSNWASAAEALVAILSVASVITRKASEKIGIPVRSVTILDAQAKARA